MPEIGEVARVVHYLRKHTLNRTIASITALDDPIVYGKVGTSASEFQKATANRRVTGVGQQGKYFYMTFDKSPHAVMHLGMTGWVKFSGEETGYYRSKKEDEEKEKEEWPPKYMKWLMKFEGEKGGEKREAVEVAFVDPRRLARIRLVECEAGEIREHSPLKENGPDPVVDREKFTLEFLEALLGRKRVPVKALLLDQANISGIGNWVADEVLYQARLHPEQYSNTFTPEQIQRLHDSIVSICTTACETLADSAQFPETWLMKYRWDKGKKGADANVLPNGEKIVHLKVGGRTSAIVPSVQKKTAGGAGDGDGVEEEGAESKPAAKGRKRKVKAEEESEGEKPVTKKAAAKGRGKANGKAAKVKEPQDSDEDAGEGAEESSDVKEEEEEAKPKKKTAAAKKEKVEKPAPAAGTRRSARTKAT